MLPRLPVPRAERYRRRMRSVLVLATLVLYLIALVALGIGVAMVIEAARGSGFRMDEANLSVWMSAVLAGTLPCVLGTIALGAAATITAVLTTGDAQAAATRESTVVLRHLLARGGP